MQANIQKLTSVQNPKQPDLAQGQSDSFLEQHKFLLEYAQGDHKGARILVKAKDLGVSNLSAAKSIKPGQVLIVKSKSKQSKNALRVLKVFPGDDPSHKKITIKGPDNKEISLFEEDLAEMSSHISINSKEGQNKNPLEELKQGDTIVFSKELFGAGIFLGVKPDGKTKYHIQKIEDKQKADPKEVKAKMTKLIENQKERRRVALAEYAKANPEKAGKPMSLKTFADVMTSPAMNLYNAGNALAMCA